MGGNFFLEVPQNAKGNTEVTLSEILNAELNLILQYKTDIIATTLGWAQGKIVTISDNCEISPLCCPARKLKGKAVKMTNF